MMAVYMFPHIVFFKGQGQVVSIVQLISLFYFSIPAGVNCPGV
jgi:hypothetical protein